MKAMISQPMADKTDHEIAATRAMAVTALKDKGYEIVDTYFKDNFKSSVNTEGVTNLGLFFLAASLQCMSLCHVVYFCKGWEDYRGCRIEHEAAKAYGLEIIYE